MATAADELDALQRAWEGVLYTRPGGKINGHAVGPFGWVGITVTAGESGELLRATYKQKKLKSTKRGASGSEEEAAAVLLLATHLIEAYKKHTGVDADAVMPQLVGRWQLCLQKAEGRIIGRVSSRKHTMPNANHHGPIWNKRCSTVRCYFDQTKKGQAAESSKRTSRPMPHCCRAAAG